MFELRRVQPVIGLLVTVFAVGIARAEPELVQYETEDGIVVHARFYAPVGELKGAAVYLHQPGRDASDWDYFGGKLAGSGIAGLAPDLRGHGESMHTVAGEEIDREAFDTDDFLDLVHDVSAAVAYLRDERAMGEHGVQLVGADVGGSAALLYAVQDPSIRTLALLSPGLMYDGVDTVGQVQAYGARPLLLVVSMEDSYATKSTEVLAKEARGLLHEQTYYGAGHGTKMINREPDLEQLLASWLLGTFQTPEGVSLAETMLKLGAQDRGQGLADVEGMAQEQRERAAKELEEQQSSSEEDSSSKEVEGSAEEPPTRWD